MRDYTPLLTGILSAAASALNAEQRSTGRTVLSPGGPVAWDDCCEGQLALRVIEVYPTMGTSGSPFPQIDAAQKGVGCGVKMVAFHLALGVIRCAATLDDSGNAPSEADVSADAVAALADLTTILDVIACAVPSIAGVQQMKVGKWTPQGVEGGCHGGEWDFYIAVDPCLCAPAPGEGPRPAPPSPEA